MTEGWEFTLFRVSLFLYLLAWTGLLAGRVFPARSARVSRLLTFYLPLLALAVHAVSLGIRTVLSGHLPLFGTYENAQVACWFLFAFTLLAGRFSPVLINSGLFTYPAGIAMLLWALRFNSQHIPLTISERSLWVDIHVFFAWLAFGSLFVAAALAFFIVRGKPEENGQEFFAEWHFRFITFGFVAFSFMMALGSFYSYLLFDRWWQWDIVEVLSLIAWILYGLIIHFRLFYPRRLKLAAWLTLFSLPLLFVAYLGLSALNVATFHNFDLTF